MTVSTQSSLSLTNTIPVVILGGFNFHVVDILTKILASQILDLTFPIILSFTYFFSWQLHEIVTFSLTILPPKPQFSIFTFYYS